MTNLERLIQELCPNGVEYKKLGDVATISRGGNFQKKDFVEQGVPCIHYGQIYTKYGLFVNSTLTFISEEKAKKQKMAVKNDVIMAVTSENIEDVCESLAWLGDGDVAVSGHTAIIHHTLNPKYLVYYLHTEHFNSQKRKLAHGTKVIEVTPDRLNDVMLPVPPLKVQREIVRVLDSFMLLTAELTTELTAELSARKKQYDFYRDKLLTHNTEYPMKPLSDLGKWTGGKTPSMAEKDFWENGTVPWISSKDMKVSTLSGTQDHITEKAVKEASMTVYPTNSIAVVTRSGILKHTFPVAYVPFETTVNQDIKILVVNEDILPRYAFHVIQGKGRDILAKTKKQGGTVDSLDFQKVLAYKVPVPSIEVQKKLVEVLDDFEKICTDLNIGLPAEIEARQKQYEYYRDLLLTFAEADKMIGGGYSENLIKLIQYVFGYVTLPMGSLFDFRNGLSKGKEFFGRGIPFIRYTDVYNNRFLRGNDITALVECTPAEIEKLRVHRGDVFFTRTSETAEDVGWSSVMLDDMGDCVYNGFTIKATPKTDYLLPEYCVFCFATDDFRQYVTSHCAFTTRASLTGKTIAEYQLAFPSIEKQQEIVEMLSKFHTLCNDLSAGLPAEIEARQKQYEYYRDKLLSFKEIQK